LTKYTCYITSAPTFCRSCHENLPYVVHLAKPAGFYVPENEEKRAIERLESSFVRGKTFSTLLRRCPRQPGAAADPHDLLFFAQLYKKKKKSWHEHKGQAVGREGKRGQD
jgi:hypothetical protein